MKHLSQGILRVILIVTKLGNVNGGRFVVRILCRIYQEIYDINHQAWALDLLGPIMAGTRMQGKGCMASKYIIKTAHHTLAGLHTDT